MTAQHTTRRWLIARLGIFVGALSLDATALDPGTVKGRFSYGGNDCALKHAYAWQPCAQTKVLWLCLTDAEVPPAAAGRQEETKATAVTEAAGKLRDKQVIERLDEDGPDTDCRSAGEHK